MKKTLYVFAPLLWVILALFALPVSLANAQALASYAVLIDTDANTATGCTVNYPSGESFNGAELRLTAPIAGNPPQVTQLVTETCVAGSFANPQVLAVTYPVGLNNGSIVASAAADVIELATAPGAVVLSASQPRVNLGFEARSASGAVDALLTTNGQAGAASISLALDLPPQAVSINRAWALLLLGLLVTLIAFRYANHVARYTPTIVLFIAFGVASSAYAAAILLDGQVSDWAGTSPVAVDRATDAAPAADRAEIYAAYAKIDGTVLSFRIDVKDVELQAPAAVGDMYTVLEDQTLTVSAPGVLSNDASLNGGALTAALVNNVSRGSLTLNADGSFVYTPSANLNGAETFTYRAVDGAQQSPPVTVTINVTPVNDAPRFTVGPNQTVLPNASAQTIAAWATGIDDGDPETTQVLSFEIANNSNPTLFSVAPQVSATGELTYTIAANQTGSATIELRLRDDGGTANGGVDVSATQSFVIAVDSAPSVTTVTPAQGAIVANNQALSITFSEPINASPGAVTLTCGGGNLITGGTSGSNVTTLTPTYAGTLPSGASCTLTVLASSVSDVDTIDPPDTMSANFVRNFTVDAAPVQLSQIPGNGSTGVAVNATIGATFSEPVNATANAIEVQCRVGTDPPVNIALSGLPLSNVTTVTVTPVNPMPSDASCTVFVFGTRITDADTIDGPDEFVGSAWSFTTVSLVAVNDAYNLAEDQTLFINASSGVLANDSPTGGNLNAVLVTAPTNGVLTLNADGSFSYTPQGNFNGNDSFTYRATDGVGNSNAVTVSLSVSAVNDAPSFTVGANQSVRENAAAQSVSNWASAISPGPADEAGQTVSFAVVSNSNAALFSVQPAISANGTLTYTPAANTNGVATINVSVQDSGGTANGGVDASPAQSFTITVTPADLAPTVVLVEVEVSNVFTSLPLASGVASDNNTDIRITFSESVNPTGTWAQLTCSASGTQSVSSGLAVTTADPVFTLNPVINLTPGESCTLTIFAANIADDDTDDPPNTMAANYVVTFNVAP